MARTNEYAHYRQEERQRLDDEAHLRDTGRVDEESKNSSMFPITWMAVFSSSSLIGSPFRNFP